MQRQTYARPRRPRAAPRTSAILRQLTPYQITIPTRKEVLSYLARHSKLRNLLPDICEKVRRDFGPDVELSLELYRDPEIDDRYLTLYVRMEQYDNQILERFEAVSKRFERKLNQVPGFLLLTTDFQLRRGPNVL